MRKTFWFKRPIQLLTVVLAVICIVFSCCTVSAENSIPQNSDFVVAQSYVTEVEGYSLYSQNEELALFGAETGEKAGTFAVMNKNDGNIWYSNPVDSAEDTIALNLMKLQSIIAVEYYDPSINSLVEVNSRIDSVAESGFRVEKIKNGMEYIFEFVNQKFTIPVEIAISQAGSLTVSINMEKVVEDGEYQIYTINLLPFFMASNSTHDGFLFVPDGSGAVIEFNNQKTTYSGYYGSVYGGDKGDIAEENKVCSERIYMPVFGISTVDGGIFSVINQGAAQSDITAAVSGLETGYNSVSNIFKIRKTTTYSLDQGWQGKKVFNVFQTTAPTIETLENKYYFLTAEEASIGGMARCYRKYLTEQGFVEKEYEPSVYVDYLGAITRKKSVLGIPSSVKCVSTDYESAKHITSDMVDSGIENLVARYINWNDKEIEGKIVNSAEISNKLGGKKEFNNLLEYMDSSGIEFYPDVNPTQYHKNNFLFQQFFHATFNMNKEVNKYYPYKLNLYVKDTTSYSHYLISLHRIEKTFSGFLNSYKNIGNSRLGLSGICEYITSDYAKEKKPMDTCDGERIYKELIEEVSKENELLLNAANMNVAVYAKHIINSPSSSDYDITDYAVPFYQMVLNGFAGYSNESINLSADARTAFLKALESGSGLHYSLTYDTSYENIKDSPYEHWIGTDYNSWLDTIEEQYAEMQMVYTILDSSKPIEYSIVTENIAKTTFSSGKVLYINYGSETEKIMDINIPSLEYAVFEGGVCVGQSE